MVVITEELEVVPKLEHSLHHTDRITEVTDLLEVVLKLDHNQSVETQVIMEAPVVAPKLDPNPSIRDSHLSDPVEDTQKLANRVMGLGFELVLMNQLTEPRRRPKVKLGSGKAEKRMTK